MAARRLGRRLVYPIPMLREYVRALKYARRCQRKAVMPRNANTHLGVRGYVFGRLPLLAVIANAGEDLDLMDADCGACHDAVTLHASAVHWQAVSGLWHGVAFPPNWKRRA